MAAGKRRHWFGRRDDPATDPETATPGPDRPPSDTGATPAIRTLQELETIFGRLSDYVRVQVRSGVYDLPELRDLTVEAASTELPDPAQADEMARRVLSGELQQWQADAARWGSRTDCDRLDRAMELIGRRGVLILAGLVDRDSLAESLRVRGVEAGCVAYLVPDIWAAIDRNSLTLTVLDGSGRPAGRRSDLVGIVTECLAESDLLGTAGPDDGQVSVALVWRRRPQF
jgi:hypothetical protein